MTSVAEMETKASPAYRGVYSSREAALYIRATMPGSLAFPKLNAWHISRWLRAGLGTDAFRHSSYRPGYVNFLDLISFRMVAALRAGGISHQSVKLAHARLQRKKGWRHPFAMASVWEGDSDTIAEIEDAAAVAQLQPLATVAVGEGDTGTIAEIEDAATVVEFHPFVTMPVWERDTGTIAEIEDAVAVAQLLPFEEGCRGLTFDLEGAAADWSPAPGVLLDPRIVSGEPCIKGSRVATSTFWGGYQRGDSMQTLARAYGKSEAEAEAALAWERKLAEFYAP